MKKYLFIILLVGVCFGQSINPCDDERFLKIKEKSLDNMTEREYQYFIKKEKECSEHNKNNDPTKPLSKNKIEDNYTNFLMSLGCRYNNEILNYYDKNSKKWIAIEDQLSFLNTLGYKEGSTINRTKGELYLFKNGKWIDQGVTKKNQNINKSNDYFMKTNSSFSPNSSPSNSSIHIFASYDISGVFKLDDSDGRDVNNEVSLGLDLMLFGNEEASFGIGGEYQTERELDIENSRGKFYFIPAYCVIRMKSQQANIIGKVGLSYFFADNDFTGQSYSNNFRASFKESLYYAAGLSISITNTIGIQVLWSRSTAEIIYDEFDTSIDVGYDKISIGFSLDADN